MSELSDFKVSIEARNCHGTRNDREAHLAKSVGWAASDLFPFHSLYRDMATTGVLVEIIDCDQFVSLRVLGPCHDCLAVC